MKVSKVYDWFAALDFLEQYEMTDKYFNSINPSRLTNGQVLEIYLEEKVNDSLDNVSNCSACGIEIEHKGKCEVCHCKGLEAYEA